MDIKSLEFLARLPLFLTSSLSTKSIIEITIDRLREALSVDAVTVFLREGESGELVFWAIRGGGQERLAGTRMPLGRGIVGFVVENHQGVVVNDVSQDKRFFKAVDAESEFETRNILCVPLLVRGGEVLGALQCLNKKGSESFSPEDFEFLEQCASQVSLAIHNSLLHERLEREHLVLKRLDERKSEMISVLSHEIKTPLTIIQGSAEILAAAAGSTPVAERTVEALSRGVTRLTDLALEIRNVSLVTGKGAGKELSAEFKPILVSELFSAVSEFFVAPLRTRTLSFEVGNTDQALQVEGDFGLILMVLKNLISNAIRFTPDGGKISLVATSSKGLAQFLVKDTGIGIPESEHDLIFEKFYEVASALHHRSGSYAFQSAGLGLGLAAAKSILVAHRSTLRVKSALDKGSEFSFHLQVAKE